MVELTCPKGHGLNCNCEAAREQRLIANAPALNGQARPRWDVWFMRLAFVTAQRGSCPRKKVGAILVRDRDHAVRAGGYNGAPSGLPDCIEAGCELRDMGAKPSCVRTIHAESNALDRAEAFDPKEPHTMYCTVIPCRDCALRIIQLGIKRVIYFEYYESRNTKDTEELFRGRVELIKLAEPIESVVGMFG